MAHTDAAVKHPGLDGDYETVSSRYPERKIAVPAVVLEDLHDAVHMVLNTACPLAPSIPSSGTMTINVMWIKRLRVAFERYQHSVREVAAGEDL